MRCCSYDGSDCITPDDDCLGWANATIEEAKTKCAGIGKRLCTPAELGSGRCCGKGCDFDNKLIWQSKYNGVL